MPEHNFSNENLKIWQLVLKAAHEVGTEIFSANDIVDNVLETNPNANETSIRTYVIGMSPNHPTSHHYPSTRKNHPYFDFLGDGKFRLLKDGNQQLSTVDLANASVNNATKPARTLKQEFFEKNHEKIDSWTEENQAALVSGRKRYCWKNKSLLESLEIRNSLSRLIVKSRVRNNGGVDRDTLDEIMAWGFPNEPVFPERDSNKCLEITREAFNLLDEGKPSDAVLKLMPINGVKISRASKVIGLFDQNYLAIYDSRVGNALKTLTIEGEKMIKCPPGRNRPGDSDCKPNDWAKNYERLLWVLEIIRNKLIEQGFLFSIADVEMALFMMGQ
jgi:hypothetical protein